jgi:hypothetical protein
MRYRVPVVYSSYGIVKVNAKNKQDLIDKLSDKEFLAKMPLPDKPAYLDDSFKIDVEGLQEIDQHGPKGNIVTLVLLNDEIKKLNNPK